MVPSYLVPRPIRNGKRDGGTDPLQSEIVGVGQMKAYQMTLNPLLQVRTTLRRTRLNIHACLLPTTSLLLAE
jgi:hypothetical protein